MLHTKFKAIGLVVLEKKKIRFLTTVNSRYLDFGYLE